MQNSFFSEKRVSPRFPVGIPLSYFESGSENAIHIQTYDIGAEGICIVTDKELPPGTCLDIYLHMLDNGEKIYRKGRVIWLNIIDSVKYRIGIKLEKPNLKTIPLVLRTIKAKRKY